MNIPNILTLIRLFLIPSFIFVFFSNTANSTYNSIIIFFIAGFTDILDGYIARKFNLITKCGTALDPLADKLMLITVLTCLLIKGYIPPWVLIIMLIKELSMIFSGIVLYHRDTVIAANIFGKLSTISFYIAILFIINDRYIGTILIYIAVCSAIIAFANYMIVYFKSFRKKPEKKP